MPHLEHTASCRKHSLSRGKQASACREVTRVSRQGCPLCVSSLKMSLNPLPLLRHRAGRSQWRVLGPQRHVLQRGRQEGQAEAADG